MSARKQSNSSSASRKTLLSSTRTTRIGSLTRARLLGGQEQPVVRLAALVHVQLELRMSLAELGQHAVQRRRALAAQQRQDVSRLGQQAIEPPPHDLVEAGAGGDRVAVEQREELAL